MLKVKENQSVMDIAILNGGHFSASINLCINNNLSLTDALSSGQLLIEPSIIDQDVVDELTSIGAIPASFLTNKAIPIGVGYWRVGFDNIVK